MAFAMLLVATTAFSGENRSHGNFVMRNDSPFSAIIGVPGRWPDDSGRTLDLSLNASNHSIFRRGAEEFVLIDGETHRVQIRYQQKLHDRINFGISVPWISHTGGFLDSTIDTWHDITGLREGIRPSRARDQLDYSYGRETFEIFGIDSSKSGLGDIMAGATIRLLRGNSAPGDTKTFGYPVDFVMNVELPSGELERLTGNDHADYAAGLRISRPRSSPGRLKWWLDFGLLWPGDVDIAGLPSRDRVFYYDAALSWRWSQNLDLLVDIAGNSALYSSELKSLGDAAAQIAAGFVWHLASGASIRVGFYEDLRAESATDFGLELAVTINSF